MTIYRAATDNTAWSGACFAPSADEAALFLQGANGGADERTLWTVEAVGQVLEVETAQELIEALREQLDASDLAQAERLAEQGFRLWEVLERLEWSFECALKAAGYTWLVYSDEAPGYAGQDLTCWRYYGAEDLTLTEA